MPKRASNPIASHKTSDPFMFKRKTTAALLCRRRKYDVTRQQLAVWCGVGVLRNLTPKFKATAAHWGLGLWGFCGPSRVWTGYAPW